jgi:inorganic pyrophosphatase
MAGSREIRVVVEIPQGHRNKYEWDPETGPIALDRFLFSSVTYPTDHGFIPDTLAEDGDPLDAMVCVSEPTFPGCNIIDKPVALFRMRDENGVDDKVLCVPCSDPNWNTIDKLEEALEVIADSRRRFEEPTD